MKKLVRRVLPVVVVLGVIAALLWYGDAPRIVATVERFQLIYLVWFVGLRLVHEALRSALWLFLIRVLALRVPVRTQVFAFAAAEAVNAVPGGAYLENAILQRSAGSAFGQSSAATTAMILGEITVGLLGVVALGVGAWSAWLRFAIIIGVVAAVVLGVVYLAAPGAARVPQRIREQRLVARALYQLERFRSGAAMLMHPPIVAVILALCALYVLVSGAALYLVVRSLAIGGVSYWQALAVVCFGLGFYAVLGSLEAAEVGVFVGMGLNKTAAVSAVLLNRALDVCVTVLLAAIVMAVLHDEWRTMRRPRGARDPESAEG